MKRERRKLNGWEARDKQVFYEEEVELLLASDRRLGKQLDYIATLFLIRVVLNRLPQGLGPTCQSTFRPGMIYTTMTCGIWISTGPTNKLPYSARPETQTS